MMSDVIKSINDNQFEIIKNIMSLCGIEQIDADVTFGNGAFYKEITHPVHKFDIDPQREGVVKADSCNIPLPDSSIKSVMFDPPFLTYVKSGRTGNGSMIMSNRFSGYWRYDELEDHYKGTISDSYRVLDKKGILIFKCQDIIHNHKMHSTHINVVNWCDGMFRLKDMFILTAKHRLPRTPNSKQKHARIFHSYFLVLESLKK